jgi:sarcosine oxidase subunit beta
MSAAGSRGTVTSDVVIIGAGSVGLPLSWELARRGLSVVVLEQHPSVGRGENRAAIGGIRATHSDAAKIHLGRRSLALVQELESRHGLAVDWLQNGYLFPVYDAEREATLSALLTVQRAHGLEIDWVDAGRVAELVPGITTDGLRGGTFSPGDGSASPLKMALAYDTLARRAGVALRCGERVRLVEHDGGRVAAVITDQGRYAAGVVVDASGAHARQTGALFGLDVPVQPDSHEAGITEPVQRFFQPMVVDIRPDQGSASYYFYQNREGQVVFCITPEPKIPGLDHDSTAEFLPQVIRRLVALYPRLRHLKVRRTWRGLYPMTPDGSPIVGPVGEPRNVYLAVGLCGQGFMLGPGLGEMLAEVIAEGPQEHHAPILRELAVARSFGEQEALR